MNRNPPAQRSSHYQKSMDACRYIVTGDSLSGAFQLKRSVVMRTKPLVISNGKDNYRLSLRFYSWNINIDSMDLIILAPSLGKHGNSFRLFLFAGGKSAVFNWRSSSMPFPELRLMQFLLLLLRHMQTLRENKSAKNNVHYRSSSNMTLIFAQCYQSLR